MGILSSTCKQSTKQSKHDKTSSSSTLKKNLHNSTSLDKDFYFKTSNSNINNNSNNKAKHKNSHSYESSKISRDNSISSLMNNKSINKETRANSSASNVNKKPNRTKSVRSINIHLINSSNNLKRHDKSASLSALDQIHIIITNIDLTNSSGNNIGGGGGGSGATPTQKILNDKIS